MERRWAKVVLPPLVAVLVLATMVWLSGMDMFVGSMLYVVVGGWSLLAAYCIGSFVQAARSRTEPWFQRWAAISLSCAMAFLWSAGIGLAGLPEHVRIWVSRDVRIVLPLGALEAPFRCSPTQLDPAPRGVFARPP